MGRRNNSPQPDWPTMYKSVERNMLEARDELRFWKKWSDRLAASASDDIAVMQYYQGAESLMKQYSSDEVITTCVECVQSGELCYKHLKVRYDYLRYLVRDVVVAVNDAGPNPQKHFKIMRRHRRQWSFLWRRMDRLREWSNRHS